jgi:Sec-independent protein translocase protein TatA
MDFFGIGAAEIIIICLVIIVVAGPKRSALWARQLGALIRKWRTTWQEAMAGLQQNLGAEGEELMKATKELRDSLGELRGSVSPARRMVNSLLQEIEAPLPNDNGTKPVTSQSPQSSSDQRYQAWLPKNGGGTDISANAEERYSAWQTKKTEGAE